jgi:hypothetical protein
MAENPRSSIVFECTGLSTEKPTNPQTSAVHPPLPHRFRTGHRRFTGSTGVAHVDRLTIEPAAGTMTGVIARHTASIIIIP